MELVPGITLLPILHGRSAFSTYLRKLCNEQYFDCFAVDLPQPFYAPLVTALDTLPFISAVTAIDEGANDPVLYYIPTDPCDVAIELLRQAQHKHLPCHFLGREKLYSPPPLLPLPDEYAIQKMGFAEYATLGMHYLDKITPPKNSDQEDNCKYIAYSLQQLKKKYKKILALIHFRHLLQVATNLKKKSVSEPSLPQSPFYTIQEFLINPDHLYFALGELPFITGKFEKERYNPFIEYIDITDTIKDLFRDTRDNFTTPQHALGQLSPVRIQNGLTFLRNLTLMEKQFVPSLFDIITAAKGIGGNTYALRILKNAKYYPYLPIEHQNQFISISIDRVIRPHTQQYDPAVNLFRDTMMEWKHLAIKPDPSLMQKKKYRYFWNPYGMCSHVPEDRHIENFNTHVRTKALQIMCEDLMKTEPFITSVKDGIDMRETLRNWHKNEIYVKEIPLSRGKVDTVIIIFDDHHDEHYPQHTTWYAEHENESTLTFYSTDPFSDLIGPGIARCIYGGLSLLFPPKNIPCTFALTENSSLKKLSHRLAYGALLFSQESAVAYIAAKKPDLILKNMARKLKRRLVWVPLSHFSAETLRKLRKFHVLNGKTVRSWASKFIGD